MKMKLQKPDTNGGSTVMLAPLKKPVYKERPPMAKLPPAKRTLDPNSVMREKEFSGPDPNSVVRPGELSSPNRAKKMYDFVKPKLRRK